LEEFSGREGENSYFSDLAAAISNKSAKADSQNLITSGCLRPTRDVRLIQYLVLYSGGTGEDSSFFVGMFGWTFGKRFLNF
jgi:hypothetical protein